MIKLLAGVGATAANTPMPQPNPMQPQPLSTNVRTNEPEHESGKSTIIF